MTMALSALLAMTGVPVSTPSGGDGSGIGRQGIFEDAAVVVMVAILLGLMILLAVWVYGLYSGRKVKRKERRRTVGEDDGEDSEESRRRRRRRRRRPHRPRNPTLADTGGLPPSKPDDGTA